MTKLLLQVRTAQGDVRQKRGGAIISCLTCISTGTPICVCVCEFMCACEVRGTIFLAPLPCFCVPTLLDQEFPDLSDGRGGGYRRRN